MSTERLMQIIGMAIIGTGLIGVLFVFAFFFDGPIHLVALGLLTAVVSFLGWMILRWVVRSIAYSAGRIRGEVESAYQEGKASTAKTDPSGH